VRSGPAAVHDPCADLPSRGGGEGLLKKLTSLRRIVPAVHETHLAAALVHHGQSPFLGSFAVS